MAWAKPQYSKAKVDWAGEIILSDPVMRTPDVELAEEIVNNWRAIHSYPLQAMKMTLKRRAKKICRHAIVAQRLKRLASIRLKLQVGMLAGNHPKLSQMQDIGGCRAVMDTVAQVRELEENFAESSRKAPHRGPEYSKTYDYIAHPKDNGYRSVHLVYRYRTASDQHKCYNGQRIEIQLRSKVQHYWATAVETYSTFSGEALKSNIGPIEWKRFFALIGSAFAVQEGCPPIPSLPGGDELLTEASVLFQRLNVGNVLGGWTAIAKWTQEEEEPMIKGAAMYLLVLNPDDFSIRIHPYAAEHLLAAHAHYAQIEKEEPNLQAVLVSVDSLAALRTAYPNYFLDTSAFLERVQGVIDA